MTDNSTSQIKREFAPDTLRKCLVDEVVEVFSCSGNNWVRGRVMGRVVTCDIIFRSLGGATSGLGLLVGLNSLLMSVRRFPRLFVNLFMAVK